MIRRTHRKSRHGCAECKRSHKKCDESRPACVSCTTAKKQCSYTQNSRSRSSSDREFVLSTVPDGLAEYRSPHLSIESQTTDSSPRPLTPPPPQAGPYLNLLHLELFQNLSSNALSVFDEGSPKDEWVATTLRYGFLYPYLMYQGLALSALHLSIKYPLKSHIYLPESTRLQAQALSLFSSTNPTFNQDNLIPAFLFSAGVGLHFFCDTFTTPSPDLNTFLDRLVQSIRLLNGIRAVYGNSYNLIKNSDIKPLLQEDDEPFVDRDDEITHAFEDLRNTFSQSRTLSAFESKVYCDAITSLIWVYNSQPTNGAPNDGPTNPRVVVTWPIKITTEYLELLTERKPEALIVMAYFSIVLYCRRTFWAVGNSGRSLLDAIGAYLGEPWAEWLVVPNRLVLPL